MKRKNNFNLFQLSTWESLTELAESVLKNKNFEHNLLFSKPLRETAIGTKMAPPYAVIFLGDLEERFFSCCDISPLLWGRYTDDIFMLWQHGENELKKFLEILNSYHPIIKFTANYSREKISFLDIDGNQLVTDLHIKPTVTCQYLHVSSCHIFHSKKSIPYSQALKLNRICSENSFFNKQCHNLEIWLRERDTMASWTGYISKARKFPRPEILNN